MAEIPARRAGQVAVFPHQARAGLDQHAMAEQLAQRRSPSRAPRQPKQYPFGAEPTGQVTLTSHVSVTTAHFRTRHAGGREWRVRRRGRCHDPRRRQPLGRMPTTYRRPPPATRSPNVASTSSDAHVSRANTRRSVRLGRPRCSSAQARRSGLVDQRLDVDLLQGGDQRRVADRVVGCDMAFSSGRAAATGGIVSC